MDMPLAPSPRKGVLEYDDLSLAVDTRKMSGADACAIEKQRRHQAALRLQAREHNLFKHRLVPRGREAERSTDAASTTAKQAPPRSPRRTTAALRPKQSFSTGDLLSQMRGSNDPSRLLMAKYTTQYKQRMVQEMKEALSTTRSAKASASKTPIQDHDWCTGVLKQGLSGVPLRSTPVLALYESERMLKKQEATAEWEWPSRTRTPSRPTSPVVERIGRLESIMTSRGGTPAAGARGGSTPGRGGGSPPRSSRHPRGCPPPWSLPATPSSGSRLGRPVRETGPYPGVGRLILTDGPGHIGPWSQPDTRVCTPSASANSEGARIGRPFHPGLMIRVA